MIAPGKGVRLGIDVGTVRIGVAKSDQDQIMALPVATLANSGTAEISDEAIEKAFEIISDIQPQVVYVGKPISLSSNETKSTQMAIEFAHKLANQVSQTPITIRLLDERLTTVSAQAQLHAAGKNSKQGKNVIDQVAAIVLLDHAMSIEKTTGTLAGESVIPIGPVEISE